jgi:hypothetical protein
MSKRRSGLSEIRILTATADLTAQRLFLSDVIIQACGSTSKFADHPRLPEPALPSRGSADQRRWETEMTALTQTDPGHQPTIRRRSWWPRRPMWRKRVAGGNPWGEGATTPKWTLSSPPPFHRFEVLPRVH